MTEQVRQPRCDQGPDGGRRLAEGACTVQGGAGRALQSERLAEYGWKPDRILGAPKSLSGASIFRYIRETQGG